MGCSFNYTREKQTTFSEGIRGKKTKIKNRKFLPEASQLMAVLNCQPWRAQGRRPYCVTLERAVEGDLAV